MAKNEIQTNLIGRTVRPSKDSPRCWPWAYKFEASAEKQNANASSVILEKKPGSPELTKDGRYCLAILEDRAEIVAVFTDREGSVKVSLEHRDGEVGEAYIGTLSLVKKPQPAGVDGLPKAADVALFVCTECGENVLKPSASGCIGGLPHKVPTPTIEGG